MRIAWLTAVLVCIAAMPWAAAVSKCTNSHGRVMYQDEPLGATLQSSKADTSNAMAAPPGKVGWASIDAVRGR